MTAAITAPTETSEPLAPAAQAGQGQGPAGAFDLLIALLQTQRPPALPIPGVPTSVVATPIAPVGAVSLGSLIGDGAVGDDEAAVLLQAAPVPALRVLRGLVPGDAASSLSEEADIVAATDDEDALDAAADPSTQTSAAALGAVIVPLPSDASALVPLASPTPGLEDGGLAREVASPSELGFATSETVVAELVDAASRSPIVDANAQPELTQGPAGDEPRTPPDAGIAAALEPRARFERSARTVDAFRAAEAAAALASVREDVARDLGAASSMTRASAATEALVDRFGGPSRETEREGSGPSIESSISATPIPGLALAPREAAAIAESSRPQPARDPIDQIATRLRDVRGPGHHEISVRLDPPELGAVRIDARLDGARLQLSISAEHAPTGELLADALPRLRDALSQQGFVPTDVTVHLGFEAAGRQFTRDDAPTFTPPRTGEPTLPSPVVRLPAAFAAVTSDGLDVWA